MRAGSGRGRWPDAVPGVDACGACGAPLPPRSGTRGRPPEYCHVDTGRPCGDFARTLTRLESLAGAILRAVPEEHHRRVALKLGGRIQAMGGDVRYGVRDDAA